MVALAWRTLRHRKGGFVATFLALFFGTVVVMACGGLLETGVRNNAPPQRLAGADLVVTGDRSYTLPKADPDDPEEDSESAVLPERVPVGAGLAATVRGVTGVRSALPERTFDAALLPGGGGKDGGADASGGPAGGDGGTAKVTAHGWESAAVTPYRLAAGREPAASGELALDARTARERGLSTGDTVRVAAHGEARPYEVTGVASAARNVPRATVFFSPARAAELSGGTVADIAVTAERGQDLGALKSRIADALPEAPGGSSARVVSGDDRGAVEYPAVLEGAETLIVLASVFGGLATLVAVFVVGGTVALSVSQRHREFALMRATGATPRQLRRMLLGETLIVALLAAAGGWAAGPYAGTLLYEQLVDAGLVEGIVVHSQGWIPAAAAGGALLLTAVAGGWVGARRAVRARPGEALAHAEGDERWLHPVRLVLAVLFLGGATALALLTVLLFDGPIAASTAGPTVMCAVIGLALLGPGLTKAMTAVLAPFVRAVSGPSGELAVLNSRARAVRTASVVVPVMLASGMALGMIYLQTTQEQASRDAFRDSLRADAVLTAPAGGVSPELAARVRALDGVSGTSAYVTTTGFVERPRAALDEDGIVLQGVTARDAARTTAVDTVRGSLGRLTGNSVALPTSVADRAGAGIGDTVRLRLGDGGAVTVRVVALFEGRAGYENALAPAALLAPHTTDGLPQQVLVRGESGKPEGEEAALLATLRDFAASHPEAGVAVADREAVLASHAQDTATQAWINYLMVGMIVAYTTIALVNSLVLSVSHRRREFGLQRLNGATAAQVLRMVAVEALLVTFAGLLLGALAASTSLIPFSVAAADTWVPSGSLWIAVTVAGGACFLTLASSLLSTWSVLRGRPIDAVAP